MASRGYKMTDYCALHGVTYPRAEGCSECRKACEESLIDLTNHIYNRHVPSKLESDPGRGRSEDVLDLRRGRPR
jgi:hypothetical protein